MARVVNLNDLTKTLTLMQVQWGKRDLLIANIIDQTILAAKNMSYDLEEWIPVSERLPEADLIGEEFLVTVAEKDVGRTFVMTLVWEGTREGWNDEYGHTSEDITAWMPLPEAYKEED